MTDPDLTERPAEPDFDGTFEGTRRRQFLLGLELDYAGRLRWLEARMTELRELQGKARPTQARNES
jgi:hypothetical protein